MEVVTALAAAGVLAAFSVFLVTNRHSSSGSLLYGRGALVLLGAVVGLSLLRVFAIVEVRWLFDLALLSLTALVPLGFLLVRAVERRERRQAELLRGAATMLMPTSEVRDLLDRVLDIVHAAVQVDSSSILLLDEESRDLHFAAQRGLDAKRAREYRISMDHPIIARLWSGSGPVVVGDVERIGGLRRLLVQEPVRSFFAVPMVTHDTLIGFLNVHRNRVSELGREEIELLTALASQVAVAIMQARLYGDLHKRYLQTISALASAMEVNDPYTLGHSRHVASVSLLIAEEMGLSDQECDAAQVAALLHDIGKLGISNHVLRKLGQLSPEERNEIRSHATLGGLVLRGVEALREVLPAVVHHHERWDGRGYPHGLAGSEIPILARIVGAADAYEVMTAGRSYREARGPDSAIAEMKREAGRQFDPEVVDALVRLHTRGDLLDVRKETPLAGAQSPAAAAS